MDDPLLSLSNLIQNAVLHACMALSPVGIKLPGSGTHRIEQFCANILTSLQTSNTKGKNKKKANQLSEQSLLPEVEIHNFYEGASTYKDFAIVICKRMAETELRNGVDSLIQEECWKVYSECQKFGITYPKWLIGESAFSLWLIFCSVSPSFSELIESENVKDILRRVFELSGYSWTDHSNVIPTQSIDFPALLEHLTNCFASLDLHPSVVTEMISDLKDELVDGVLRKGYMEKKGQRAPTIKRRWFVLTRNVLIYYHSRDRLEEKGRIILNPTTTTEVLPDKHDRKHRFTVTCGKSGRVYELFADDNKLRNEWILDIGKAIQLENAFQQKNQEDFLQSLTHFYRLRYGTVTPNIPRADSLLTRMKGSFSSAVQKRIDQASESSLPTSSPRPTSGFSSEILVRSCNVPMTSASITGSEQSDDVYVDMDDLGGGESGETDVNTRNSRSEDEESGYTFMYLGKQSLREKVTKTKDEDDNRVSLPYEVVDVAPKKISHDASQNYDKEVQEVSSIHSPEKSSRNTFYLTIGELSKDTDHDKKLDSQIESKEQLDKSAKEVATIATRDVPIPPPRPMETFLYSSQSMSTINDVPPAPHYRAISRARPQSEICSTLHSVKLSPTSEKPSSSTTPVPPPRPPQTIAANITQTIKLDHETNNAQASPTSQPVWDTSITERKTSLGEEPCLRHPPYSEDNPTVPEHELYYIVPNSPSLK